MSIITDLYTQLFGKDHIKDGDVISFSEHGRVGGLSTGQPFKFTNVVDKDSGASFGINSDGSVNVVPNGSIVDDNNSTTTPLIADAVFTGTATEILHFASIALLVHSDVASAEGGLKIMFSPDGTDWHEGEAYTVPADTAKFFTPPVQARYMRIEYTNGGTGQSTFHLHTLLKKTPIKWSSHNLQDSLNDEDDAELNVSVLKLRTAQDTYVSGAATSTGNFKVSLEELETGVSSNSNSQLNVTQYLSNGNEGIQAADSASVDAFSRWRVSNTGQRFDVEFIYDKQPQIIDELTNNGTATHDTDGRDVILSLSDANNGSYAALYSHWDIPYTAGNSQLIDLTAALDNAAIGGGTAQLFLRSKVTGSVVEEVYDQANWDNPVAEINWAYSQIFMIDFQSLKVGRIRFYLNKGGVSTLVHEITNDNEKSTGYWQNPTLPLYWRLYNDATYTYMEVGYGDTDNAVGFRYRITANASATLRAICGTVKSEGGPSLFDIPGYNNTIDNVITPVTVSTTLIPVISVRPKTTFNSLTNRGLFIPTSWEVQTDNPIRVVVLTRPSLTNASWVDVGTTTSGMEYDVSATAVTGGKIIDAGYIATGVNSKERITGLLGKTLLSLSRTGTSDILTIAAIRTGATNASVLAELAWREIR